MTAGEDRLAAAGPAPASGRRPLAWVDAHLVDGLLIILFLDNFSRSSESFTSVLDELFIGYLLVRLALLGTYLTRPVLLMLVGFSLYALAGAFSALIYPLDGYPQLRAAALGIFLDAKVLLAMLGLLAVLARDPEPDRIVRRCCLILLALALVNSLFVLRDVLVGGPSILGEPLSYRGGWIEPHGLFHHKVQSAQVSAFGFIAAAGLCVESIRLRDALLILYLITIIVIHLTVKELAATGLVLIGFLLASSSFHRTLRVASLVAGIGVAGALAFQQQSPLGTAFSELSRRYIAANDEERRIRAELVGAAFDLARTHFPWGTGAGTFSSKPSRDLAYSPIYYRYGLDEIYGGNPKDPRFLLDGFWPKVAGEAGVVGLAGYLLFLSVPVVVCTMLLPHPSCARFFAWGVTISATMISAGMSSFTSERFVPLLALGWAFALLERERNGHGNATPWGSAAKGRRA
jgi:hypothetical protein